jgi:hypothetical protein
MLVMQGQEPAFQKTTAECFASSLQTMGQLRHEAKSGFCGYLQFAEQSRLEIDWPLVSAAFAKLHYIQYRTLVVL